MNTKQLSLLSASFAIGLLALYMFASKDGLAEGPCNKYERSNKQAESSKCMMLYGNFPSGCLENAEESCKHGAQGLVMVEPLPNESRYFSRTLTETEWKHAELKGQTICANIYNCAWNGEICYPSEIAKDPETGKDIVRTVPYYDNADCYIGS